MTKEPHKSTAGKTAEALATAITDAAQDEAQTQSDMAKELLADRGQRLAQDLCGTAATRGDDSLQGRLLDMAADGVAELSEALRLRSAGSLLQEANALARQNPGVFVAGAALAGFAAARFVVATDPAGGNHDD